jgi:hypothetical protein
VTPHTATSRAADSAAATAVRPVVSLTVRLVLLLGVAWVLVLAGMALTTANPVQVSPAQIRAADAVVTATRSGDFQIDVERVWSGDIEKGKASVLNLDSATFSAGTQYVIPLTKFRSGWIITTLHGQRKRPLIYPATPEVHDALRRSLPPKRLP